MFVFVCINLILRELIVIVTRLKKYFFKYNLLESSEDTQIRSTRRTDFFISGFSMQRKEG